MARIFPVKLLSIAISFALATTTLRGEVVILQSTTPTQSTGYSGYGAELSAGELQQLVAPIALYPDSLVAQVLGGATFPDQIALAGSWLQQNKSLTGTALIQAVDAQPWDPAVKALTQFPSILDSLTKNVARH